MRPDLPTSIRHYYDTAQPAIEVDEIIERVIERIEPGAQRGREIRHRMRNLPAWSAAVAGFAGVVVLGGIVGWLLAGGRDSIPVIDEGPGDTVSSTVASTIPAPADWDPTLVTTVAGIPPTAAGCPVGTDPDAPGPADRDRPPSHPRSNQTAVFDQHAGRIVYVFGELDGAREWVPAQTWTFDVCTNTWHRMDPGGDPDLPGNLVYDVDSDRTISFATETVGVYDENANAWTRRGRPAGFQGDGGAVYDPISGLVIVQLYSDDAITLAAYDVDTDRWTLVGTQTQPTGAYLVGYIAEIDRLVLQGYDTSQRDTNAFPGPTGGLLDPRSGEMTLLPEPGPLISGGFGAFVYATGTDDAVILTNDRGICRLDPTALDWNACVEPELEFPAYDAMVFDPINRRLVLMNGLGGVWWTDTTDGVWAIDLASGERHQLVPAVSATAEQDG